VSRPRVYISYSSKDEAWLGRVLAHLDVLVSSGHIEAWSDRNIAAGSDWYEEIRQALESASLAILLISPSFLTSDFILNAELPALLRRQQRGQLRIIPLILKPCPWLEVPWLASLQARPRNGRPLATLPKARAESELRAFAAEILSLLSSNGLDVERTGSFSVGQILLKNLRGFREIDLDFCNPARQPRARTLIIGRNGTCKSSLLRSIALSLCDPVDAGSLIAEPIGSLVAEGAETAEIEVHLVTRTGLSNFLVLRQEVWHADAKDSIRDLESQRPAQAPFVCAYGAGRFGIGTDTGRGYRIRDSVATLFDYRQALIDSELTLRRMQDFLGTRRFDATLLGVKRVLGLIEEDEIHLAKGGGVEVSGPTVGRRVRLEGWADGYRLTFAWLLDLYGWAMRADRITPDGGIDGILLIDEIEQHLHPSMQTGILPRLSEILPDLQIIATTHSPLVALGAAPDELISLRREPDGSVIAEPSVPDFSDYSAEDMLVDERLFDTEAYGPETTEKLDRYRQLVKIPPPRREREQTQELQALATELRARQIPEIRESPAAVELKRLIAKHNL
jgi:predicted ATPase